MAANRGSSGLGTEFRSLEQRVDVPVRATEMEPAVAGRTARPGDFVEQLDAGLGKFCTGSDDVVYLQADYRPSSVVGRREAAIINVSTSVKKRRVSSNLSVLVPSQARRWTFTPRRPFFSCSRWCYRS